MLIDGQPQTQVTDDMKSFKELSLLFVLLLSVITATAKAETWWVRADGAPHYSEGFSKLAWRGLDANHTCDGKHDAPWPPVGTANILGQISTGLNQPCAVSDWRWLYDDQGSYGQLKWIIAGGDSVVLDNTKQWRVGWDGDGTARGSEPWCWGWSAGPYGCYNPPVPAGTPEHHTRILGRNYLSCANADGTANHSQMSQIFGGHAVGAVLNLSNAQFVDVGCLEVTQHARCVRHGDPALPYQCNSDFTQGQPLDDFDADGINTSQGTHDLTLQNLWIHGHTDRAIIGAIGGLVTASGVDISANGMAGWDFDDGNSTPSVNGVLKMDHSLIEFSGCTEAADGSIGRCYSQSTGGYGDGIGTPTNSGMDVYIDHSVFRYNTQDGPDLVHIDSGDHILKFTNNQSYGNSGATLKFGPGFRTADISNNVLIANCMRLSASLPRTSAGFNDRLQDYCRAFNGFGFGIRNASSVTFSRNTLVGYAPTLIDPACGDNTCADAVVTFTDNIIRGYDNPATYTLGGKLGGPGLFCGYGCDNTGVPLGKLNRDHNLYYGTRADSQANKATGYAVTEVATNETGGIDPLFLNEPLGTGATFKEAELDNFNTALAQNSPAVNMGAQAEPVTVSPTKPSVPLASPPIGYLDNIAGSISGYVPVSAASSMVVTGWAIQYTDYGPAKSVQILVDGQPVASVIPNSPRPDVVNQVTGKAVSLNCGWSLTISSAGYTAGAHTISAVATDSAGQTNTLTNFPAGFSVIAPPAESGPVATPVSITVVLSDGSTYKGTIAKQ